MEPIYNLFLMWNDFVCSSVRYVIHDVDLEDDAALTFLQQRVPMDLHTSKPIELTKPFTKDEFDARTRLRQGLVLIEEVFKKLGASKQPLFVITPVVNGIPQVEFKAEMGDPNIYLRDDMTVDHKMDDWLIKYTKGNLIDLPALINDDYFLAIKQTFNAKHYVSSMKLLLSAIDAIAYIEHGDKLGKPTIFERWLATYADLSPLGITPQELWELRNGLLHMSNLNSRQVDKKTVRKISFHVGALPFCERDGIYYFSFYGLIQAVSQGINRWIESYNAEPGKMTLFVTRYDQTISDSRLAVYTGNNGQS